MRKHVTFLLIVCIFSFFSFKNLLSQSFYFDKYGVREGLGQSKVYDILQDRNGFIWLGTAAGVTKFNGAQFVNYSSENGLAANGVKTIFYDSLQRLWFGHIGGGISMYDGQKFIKIKIGEIKKDVSKILEDKEHNIWISTEENGVFKITNPYDKTGNYKVIRYSGNLSDRVFGMTYSSQLGILFITDIGVKYFDKKSNSFEFITKIYPKWPQYFNTICLYEDSKKNLWVGTYNGGLYKFSNNLSEPKIYDIRDGLAWNWISCIKESQDGSIWVGTWGGGISKINSIEIRNFTVNNGLNDMEIRCVTEDIEGNIIIGTNNSGINIFKGFSFVHYQNLDEKPVQVYGVTKRSPDRYFLATNKGVKSLEISKTNLPSGLKTFNRMNSNALMSDDVRFLVPDSKNTMWVGCWNAGGVSTIDYKSGKLNYNPILNGPIFDWGRGNVTAMTINHKDELFVGTNDALIYFDISSNKGSILKQTDGLASSDISALYTDRKNITWVGSRGKGITKIDGSSIKIVNSEFLFTPTCFKENNSGQLWVGTEGAGIFLLEDNTIIKKYTISDGLLSNLITAIEIDNAGNVYIGTNKGLNYLSLQEKRLIAFTEKDGFIGLEVKPNSMFKDEKGRIWIGTAYGLTLCNPDLIKINKKPPLVHISRLRINLEDYPVKQNISLKYNQNSILIDFQGVCISDAEKVKYQIKLEGADYDWQPITNQNSINYPSLSSGDYTLMVRSCNNHGIWNEKPTILKFTIHPPFWRTWWFYSIIAILLVVGIVAFIKIRERNLKIEKAILEEKVKQRTIEIQEKNLELAQKNKDITDSINYARRIQSALMPPVNELKISVKNSFILYLPKDIVSGDFYWHTQQNGKTLVAAADCTGHGVPGAFMSMISISSLNQIVKERGITDPGEILNQLRSNIISALKQTSIESDTKDGLDITLVSISEDGKKLEFAGAYNSLYLVKQSNFESSDYLDERFKISNNVVEIKADRMPIGMSEKLDKQFQTIELDIQKGDKFYLTTDGYIDQFGGAEGKKLMSKRFKEFIVTLPEGSEESQENLKNNFYNWKGNIEQIDDVLVIGLAF